MDGSFVRLGSSKRAGVVMLIHIILGDDDDVGLNVL